MPRVVVPLLVSGALHGLLLATLAGFRPPATAAAATPVQIKVIEKPPALPPELPPAATPLPPPTAAPQPARPPLSPKLRLPAPAPSAPPPSNLPPPPGTPPPATPNSTYGGVTIDSLVEGDASMAMPTGETTLAPPGRGRGRADSEEPARPGPPPGPGGARELFVREEPEVEHEVHAVYPADAERQGIEGQVKLSVEVREDGSVGEVRIIGRVGHGLDEAAAQALKRFRFRPAMANNGKPVRMRIVYYYTFEIPR